MNADMRPASVAGTYQGLKYLDLSPSDPRVTDQWLVHQIVLLSHVQYFLFGNEGHTIYPDLMDQNYGLLLCSHELKPLLEEGRQRASRGAQPLIEFFQVVDSVKDRLTANHNAKKDIPAYRFNMPPVLHDANICINHAKDILKRGNYHKAPIPSTDLARWQPEASNPHQPFDHLRASTETRTEPTRPAQRLDAGFYIGPRAQA